MPVRASYFWKTVRFASESVAKRGTPAEGVDDEPQTEFIAGTAATDARVVAGFAGARNAPMARASGTEFGLESP